MMNLNDLFCSSFVRFFAAGAAAFFGAEGIEAGIEAAGETSAVDFPSAIFVSISLPLAFVEAPGAYGVTSFELMMLIVANII